MSEFDKFNSSNVRFSTGAGGLTCIDVCNQFASARISRHGAHVMSFIPKGQTDVLWMSQASYFAEGKPIRGGVPVCWPYFGGAPDGKGPSHGYARIADWDVAGIDELADGRTMITLALNDGMTGEAKPEFKFDLTLRITVGSTLEMMLETVNNDTHTQEISQALHTYYTVGDVSGIAVKGLDGCRCLDTLDHSEYVQHGDVVIDREVDRVYFDCTAPIEINDPVLNRVIRLERVGSKSAVVWNPWIEKSKRMPDYGDHEYPGMVCVETTNAGPYDKLMLAPGEKHIIGSIISVYKRG